MDGSISDDETFIVRFEAYEGPIEALLDLARAQRIDLSRINMIELVSQFEAIVGRATALKLELAADWLVMAAWLAYLKSREMLRRPKAEAREEPDADALAFHLRRLDAVKRATEEIVARRQVGVDWFAPGGGAPSPAARLGASFYELLVAYARTVSRDTVEELPADPLKPFDLCSVDAALGTVARSIQGRDWTDLLEIVPRADGLRLRSNIATHLVAALELARDGRLEIAQERQDDPILIRKREPSHA